jgi:hypothetical protein
VPSYAVNVPTGFAQPIWYGNPNDPTPITIANTSATTANLWVGETQSVGPTNPNNSTEIGPGGYVSYDGTQEVYYAVADGAGATVQILVGVTSFFLPASLASLGGVSVFNQATAPPIVGTPPNSLWFKTDGSLWQLIGGVWTEQQFNANNLIEAGTIVAALIAAGIVVAGIVNSTEIDGALIRVKNSFGATVMTINKNAGTWIQYLDTGSATQGIPCASSSNAGFTDEFSNVLLAGTVTYALVSGTIYAVQNLSGSINFNSAPNWTGTWNVYASLEPDSTTGALGYFDNGGNKYYIGNRAFRNNAVPVTISSTTLGTILTIGPLEPSGQGYHIVGQALYLGNQAAGAPIFSFTASGGLILSSQQNGFQRFSGGGVAPIIHNNNGALGAVTGPTFAAATTNWLYEFDIYVTVNTGGSLAITAGENTAGDSFVINQVYANVEHY